MKRDNHVFIHIAFIALAAVGLYSCSTDRKAQTVVAVELRDTTHTRVLEAAGTAEKVTHAETRDTITQTGQIAGQLKIERDTAGRPVLYTWSASQLMLATGAGKWNFATEINGNVAGTATDNKREIAAQVQKVEKESKKSGVRPENFIGAALLAFVILYVIYVFIEKIWREHKLTYTGQSKK